MPEGTMSDTRKTSEYKRIEDLFLDPANFRLPQTFELEEQRELCAFIEARYDLDELGESIARDGFRPEEPLIAVEEDGLLIVVEGNRRLSTLRLLTDQSFRAVLPESRRKRWSQLAATPPVTGGDLLEVPVVVYAERSEVEGSLGFRHVSGIAPWSAESKARYVSHLVRQGHKFSEVARMIGSKSDYIRRQYVAHAALLEAAANEVETDRAERYFGVYYRALSSPLAREFVGIDWSEENAEDPRLRQGTEPMAEFLSFLFGTPEEPPVITDSRRVDDLGRVLGDETARSVLREERSLEAALDVLGGDVSATNAQLRGALARLRQANGAAFEFAGDEDLIDLAQKCLHTAERILEQLKTPGSTE